jgi:hypothetical protein
MSTLNWRQSAARRGEPSSPQRCFTRVSSGGAPGSLRCLSAITCRRHSAEPCPSRLPEARGLSASREPTSAQRKSLNHNRTHHKGKGPHRYGPLRIDREARHFHHGPAGPVQLQIPDSSTSSESFRSDTARASCMVATRTAHSPSAVVRAADGSCGDKRVATTSTMDCIPSL